MFDSQKETVIVYNEKFITWKLNKLRKHGFTFNTTSDTEVLINGYKFWGIDVVKLNGMFALAIIDLKTKKLLIARDRAGEKPLLSLQYEFLSFSSELNVY